MITPTDFKTRFPEFDSVDDTRVQMFIDDAVLELIQSVWDVYYDLGLFYLTAHYLALATASNQGNGSSSAVGPLSQATVGNVSASFAKKTPGTDSEEYYNSTQYGQRYWKMMSQVATKPVLVC